MDGSEFVDRALAAFNRRQRRVVVRRLGASEAPAAPSAPVPPASAVHALAIERRLLFAQLYITGSGIEIGALDAPLPLPAGARVRYLDRLPTDELRRHYPGLDVVDVDVVDDGERLTCVPLASQDFVVANHFLEHCQDPIGTLRTLAGRLRPGGVLYMAVPDADQTFDAARPSTAWAHLLADHEEGPERSRRDHYEEWVRLVEGVDAAGAPLRVGELMAMGYSIHFHVWRMHELLAFFAACIDDIGVDLTLEAAARFGLETICVLRRNGAPAG